VAFAKPNSTRKRGVGGAHDKDSRTETVRCCPSFFIAKVKRWIRQWLFLQPRSVSSSSTSSSVFSLSAGGKSVLVSDKSKWTLRQLEAEPCLRLIQQRLANWHLIEMTTKELAVTLFMMSDGRLFLALLQAGDCLRCPAAWDDLVEFVRDEFAQSGSNSEACE